MKLSVLVGITIRETLVIRMLCRRFLPVRPFLLASALALMFVAPPAMAGQVVVDVRGDYPGLQANAEAFLRDIEGRSADSLRRYADTAKTQVRNALKALGYYRPTITWQVVQLAEDNNPPQLKLTVTPGEPVRVSSRVVDIRGPARQDSEFKPDLPARPAQGDVLDHGAYNALRQAIRNTASRLGYFDGQFSTRRLAVDPEKGTADITLIFDSGQRLRLGDVQFRDGHGFDTDLLDQFVTFEKGTVYHSDKIARLNSHLSNSGYFASVDVNADPATAKDGVIPVIVDLIKVDRRSVAAGIGFSTDVGPRLRGTWREHWINAMGHRRGAETELSQPRQNISAWYELPLAPPMTDSIRLSTGYQREDIEDIESEQITLGQQWKHQLGNGWLQTVSVNWEGERFRLGNSAREQSQLLLPGVGYSRLSSDSAFDPSQGYRLSLEVAGAHRAVLSQTDILHVQALAKGLFTLADRHRFLSRVSLGGVATNRFEDVPPSLRFFTGGDQSVRGYGYQTLSPEDSDKTRVGGRFLMVGSVEYQYEFMDRWRAAAFMDRGNALDDLSDKLATGAGIGIRWISPVGPLRFDIAKGLDPEFGGDWRVHFSMGPEL